MSVCGPVRVCVRFRINREAHSSRPVDIFINTISYGRTPQFTYNVRAAESLLQQYTTMRAGTYRYTFTYNILIYLCCLCVVMWPQWCLKGLHNERTVFISVSKKLSFSLSFSHTRTHSLVVVILLMLMFADGLCGMCVCVCGVCVRICVYTGFCVLICIGYSQMHLLPNVLRYFFAPLFAPSPSTEQRSEGFFFFITQ